MVDRQPVYNPSQSPSANSSRNLHHGTRSSSRVGCSRLRSLLISNSPTKGHIHHHVTSLERSAPEFNTLGSSASPSITQHHLPQARSSIHHPHSPTFTLKAKDISPLQELFPDSPDHPLKIPYRFGGHIN